MAKTAETKTNVMRILDQKRIPYTAHSYPHAEGQAVDGVTVASFLGMAPERVFKTLVTMYLISRWKRRWISKRRPGRWGKNPSPCCLDGICCP